jgi:flavin-dependent dehydrogenase
MAGTARFNQLTLEDNSRIAVIGGGPSGSFFSIFALKMSKLIGKKLNISIFDSKNFNKSGPGGCNRCGGVISELLVQTLAVEGINIPDSVVQKGINSYATVYRGGGPKGVIGEHKESFDGFLLDEAVKEGAVHNPVKIDRIEYRDKRPVLYAGGRMLYDADLVVGACGVNSSATSLFEDMGFGYTRPQTTTTAIFEMSFDNVEIANHFGSSIHLFLLPFKNIKFGAMIPKGTYVTLCLLGRGLNAKIAKEFLDHPVVRSALPDLAPYDLSCRCLPKMNIRAPKIAFADRVVMCGDAGSTRLYKDGLGAAYLMGKAAARAAVFQGVSREHFRKDYYPVYKSIVIDNRFGSFLYSVIDMYRKYGFLTKGMVRVVRDEQQNPSDPKRLSSILWDMFTGNERYKNIFGTAVSIPMHLDIWRELAKILMRR